MNNAAMNIVYVYVWTYVVFSFLLGRLLAVELLSHMEKSLMFKEISKLVYTPSCNEWGLQFLYILSNICYHWFVFIRAIHF